MLPIEATVVQPGMLLQDRYRVVQQLGKGGFGQTFEVDDGGTAKVLKVLLTKYPKAVSLFQREAEVLNRLRHPGIPRVEPDGYFTFLPMKSQETLPDFHLRQPMMFRNEKADGYFTFLPLEIQEPLHCLVMEKIDGLNLQEWLKNNQPITQEQATNWLKQLAEILEKVHQQQYFHRDIKPSNIMLKPDGQLVLIDFGAVREVTETYLGKLEGKEITGINSPGYTPPEQSDGEAVLQSDFFALGRTFVHLLTGKHPLHCPKNAQTGELNWRIFAPQISEPFAKLINDLMATYPGQRPQNTQMILQRLETEQLFWVRGLSENDQSTTTLLPTTQGSSDRTSYSTNVSLENSQNTTAIPPTRQERRSIHPLISVGFAVLILLGFIGTRLALPRIAVIYNDRGVKHYLANQPSQALLDFNLAIKLDPNFAEAYYNRGVIYEDLRDFDRARTEYQIAAKGGISGGYNNLARLYIIRDKDYAAAVNLIGQGMKQAKPDKEMKYVLHKNLGWARLEQARYTEAKEQLQMAINLASNRAAAHCLLAQVLEAQNNQKEALVRWESCRNYASEYNSDEDIWKGMAEKRLAGLQEKK